MIISILLISAFILLIGFGVTEKNAKYLLSGYNTMSSKERANFNLPNFLKFFKTFHILLAPIYLVICLLLYFFANEEIFALSISIIPIFAYIYLFWQSRHYHNSGKLPMLTKLWLFSLLFIGLGLVVVFQFL